MRPHRSRRPRSAPLEDHRPHTSFVFEGRTIRARAGQSIAAALLADGVQVLTRSFKLHRPRGYTCGYDACPNCPLTVDGLPGVTACVTPVRGGERVRRERGWPSADVDVLAVTNLLSRFLGAGFQFRHLAQHPGLARWWERAMAQVAGSGRMPTTAAAARLRASRTLTRRPDVLVIGGGHSGIAAAAAAARTGADTVLVHRDVLGGRSRLRRRRDGVDPAEAVAPADVDVVPATVVGLFESGVLSAVGDGRLYEFEPTAVIVATGSYDVPLAFAGNDKPGVMLASGARRLLHLDRVRPGSRAVVVTDTTDGRQLAAELVEGGVEVVAVVSPPELARAVGARRVRGVDVGRGRTRRVRCDLVCVAVGERPADELVLQTRYLAADTMTSVKRWEPGADFGGRLTDDTWVVGSAAGWVDDDARCETAGVEAARYARGGVPDG